MLITLRCQMVKTQQGTNDACKPILAKEVTLPYHRGPYLMLVPKARFHVRKPFICPDCKCLSSVKIVK